MIWNNLEKDEKRLRRFQSTIAACCYAGFVVIKIDTERNSRTDATRIGWNRNNREKPRYWKERRLVFVPKCKIESFSSVFVVQLFDTLFQRALIWQLIWPSDSLSWFFFFSASRLLSCSFLPAGPLCAPRKLFCVSTLSFCLTLYFFIFFFCVNELSIKSPRWNIDYVIHSESECLCTPCNLEWNYCGLNPLLGVALVV